MTITTRAGKGSALTHAELDANFTDLGLSHGDTNVDLDVDTITSTTGDITTVNATDVNATDVNATGDIISGSIKARGTLSISDPTVGAVDNHQARLIVDESDPHTPKLKVQLVEGASDTVEDYISMYNGEIIVDKPMSINTDITTYGKNPDNISIYSSNNNYDGHSFIRTGQSGASAKTSVLFQTVYGSAAQVGQGTGYWTTIKNNDGAFHAGAVISSLKSYTSATDYATELQFRPVKNDNGTLDLNSSILKVNHDGVIIANSIKNERFSITHNNTVNSSEATLKLDDDVGNTLDYIKLEDPSSGYQTVEMEQLFVPKKVADKDSYATANLPTGAIVFDESENKFYGWNGTSWVAFH